MPQAPECGYVYSDENNISRICERPRASNGFRNGKQQWKPTCNVHRNLNSRRSAAKSTDPSTGSADIQTAVRTMLELTPESVPRDENNKPKVPTEDMMRAVELIMSGNASPEQMQHATAVINAAKFLYDNYRDDRQEVEREVVYFVDYPPDACVNCGLNPSEPDSAQYV